MRELKLDKLPKKVLARLDLETAFVASRSVVAAEKLLVFRKLHGRELSAAAVGRRVGIHRKYCESFLDFLVFLGLLRKREGLYRNSPLANKHFIRERSVGWTRFWSAKSASLIINLHWRTPSGRKNSPTHSTMQTKQTPKPWLRIWICQTIKPFWMSAAGRVLCPSLWRGQIRT